MTKTALSITGLLNTGRIKIDPTAKAPEQPFGAGTGEYVAGTLPFKLRIDRIDDSPYQPRLTYDEQALAELAATLNTAGQHEPIKVRAMDNGRYELISGHRRKRAAAMLGWQMIDAYIVNVTDAEAQRATMLANEARENLTDYERAKLYAHALDLGIVKNQESVADYFGTSQATVSRCLAMLTLPPDYLAKLEDDAGAISAKEAAEIRKQLKEPPPPRPTPAKRPGSVITGADNKPMFTARASGREISIRINDANIDSIKAKAAIMTALQELADCEKNAQ